MIQRVATNHSAGNRADDKKWKVFRVALASLAVILLVLGMSVMAVGCGDEGTADGPQAAAQKFLTASENKDVDAVLELMDPEIVAAMESDLEAQGMSLDDVKEMISSELFPFDSVEFTDVEMETTEIGDNEAIVTIVAGTLTQTVDGVTETRDATDSDAPVELYLVQIDGQWYIDFDSM